MSIAFRVTCSRNITCVRLFCKSTILVFFIAAKKWVQKVKNLEISWASLSIYAHIRKFRINHCTGCLWKPEKSKPLCFSSTFISKRRLFTKALCRSHRCFFTYCQISQKPFVQFLYNFYSINFIVIVTNQYNYFENKKWPLLSNYAVYFPRLIGVSTW